MKEAALNDPPPSEWDSGLAGPVSALLLLADDDAERLESRVAGFDPPDAVTLLSIERGSELPGRIEHFGFVDGISQPLFLDEDIEAARAREDGRLLWDPATPLRGVLAPDPYGKGENSFGSYAVFRKLRQDVARFEAGVAGLAEAAATDEVTAGAMVVGRFKDGTPLALAREPGLGPANRFTYFADGAGRACPYASHIRRVNPRGQLDYVAHTPDIENRIARRGVPYGRPGEADVGLLFLCFQSDIAAQFELIQNNWCNFPHFPIVGAGRDPLVGQRNPWDHGSGQQWPVPQPNGGVVTFDFPACVTMRGGEYLFAPSLSFLRGLGA
jgi:Dyp-type peroxidase family